MVSEASPSRCSVGGRTYGADAPNPTSLRAIGRAVRPPDGAQQGFHGGTAGGVDVGLTREQFGPLSASGG
jgi:hypothetical protein